MLFLNNIVGNNETQLQGWRLNNVAGLTATSGLDSRHNGLVEFYGGEPYFYSSGSDSWFPFRSVAALSQIPLSNGKFIVGNASNVGEEKLKSDIALSGFGAAAASVDLGNQKITNLADPTLPTDAANKRYVDNAVQGLSAKTACVLATDAALPRSPTYDAPTLRLTAGSNGALTATEVDSGAGVYSLQVGDRILVKNQLTSSHNGIYIVLSLGAVGAPYVLERSQDANTNSELASAYCAVLNGSSDGISYIQTSTSYDITVPSGSVTFEVFSSAASYTAGRGIVLSGTEIHFMKSTAYTPYSMFYANSDSTVAELTPPATSGAYLRGLNGSAPVWSTLTLPNTIGANSLLFGSAVNTVGEVSSAANRVLTTNGAGVPAFGTDLPTAVTIGGAYVYRVGGTNVALADGGTGADLVNDPGGIVYCGATTLEILPDGTSGHFLTSGGTGAPAWFNLFFNANTWQANQTFTSGATPATRITISSSTLGGSGTVDSPYLLMVGHGYDSSDHSANWRMFVNVTTNAGGSNFQIGNYIGAASYAAKLTLTDAGVVTLGGDTLKLTSSSYTSSLQTAALDANRTITFPNLTGTVMLLSGGQTISSGVWQGSVIGTQYGGTGANLSATGANGGLVWRLSSSAFSITAAGSLNQILLSGAANTPTWSPYTMPSGSPGKGNILYTTSTSAAAWLAAPVRNSALFYDANTQAPYWIDTSDSTLGGSICAARVYGAQLTGDGVNAYLTLQHNLLTQKLVWSLRKSNSGIETLPKEFAATKVEMIDANNIRFYFSRVQTASDVYMATVVG